MAGPHARESHQTLVSAACVAAQAASSAADAASALASAAGGSTSPSAAVANIAADRAATAADMATAAADILSGRGGCGSSGGGGLRGDRVTGPAGGGFHAATAAAAMDAVDPGGGSTITHMAQDASSGLAGNGNGGGERRRAMGTAGRAMRQRTFVGKDDPVAPGSVRADESMRVTRDGHHLSMDDPAGQAGG